MWYCYRSCRHPRGQSRLRCHPRQLRNGYRDRDRHRSPTLSTIIARALRRLSYRGEGRQVMASDVTQTVADYVEQTLGKKSYQFICAVVANCKMLALELDGEDAGQL